VGLVQAQVLEEQTEIPGGQPSLGVGQKKGGLDYRKRDLNALHGVEYWELELELEPRIDTCIYGQQRKGTFFGREISLILDFSCWKSFRLTLDFVISCSFSYLIAILE